MSAPVAAADLVDVFLSHHSHNKDWVRSLKKELERRGVTAWLDERELPEQDNFVEGLSAAGLRRCRFLVLVVTKEGLTRPWVRWEWTTFMALSGPLGRVIPVLLEDVPLPPALAANQALRAAGRPVAEVAEQVARRVARLKELPEDDPRRLTAGQLLAFDLRREGDALQVVGPEGKDRPAPSPLNDAGFDSHLRAFRRLVRTPVLADADRADLVQAATAVGRGLADVLFTGPDAERLAGLRVAGARPLLVLGGDDELLALPWEVLHDGTDFLLREGRLDLIRTTRTEVDESCLLTEPTGPFTLVVNVSAPAGESELSYETESYRLTRALTEHCPMTPTELGTLDDLVRTVQRVAPTWVHFSGHGGPGTLLFEDDEGRPAPVAVKALADRLRREHRPPSFFYLACCHGNDVGEGAESAAARMHREGVAQVVGYSGPVVDELSTRAEEALYAALAAGETTRQAVRKARAALLRHAGELEERHREPGSGAARAQGDPFPFAWSQLVLYHRGPEFPLGTKTTAAQLRQVEQELPEREVVEEAEGRRVLRTGFIGRRTELHAVRKRLRRKERVIVFQGLGGLGKSTLAFQVPRLLGIPPAEEPGRVCVLWCHEAAQRADAAEALAAQFLDWCRRRVGEAAWAEIDAALDPLADPVRRFAAALQVVLSRVPDLVLIVDNLESLLTGPGDTGAEAAPDPEAFGEWRGEPLRNLWLLLKRAAESSPKLWVIASCRYRHADFGRALLAVTPLPPDATFRLTAWFPALRRLAPATRAELVRRLAGHPRAVEFADVLVDQALAAWEEEHGEWQLPQPPGPADLEREWSALVDAVLPRVNEKLWADLLLEAIWDRVLDERARRMLYRMTLLRRPWTRELMDHLGEAPEDPATQRTAARLRRASLVMQEETADGLAFSLHPATTAYVRARFADDTALRQEAHRRVGKYLEEQAKTSPWIETYLEAGHHLFEAGEYDRAYEFLGTSSQWLQRRGRVREGLRVLEPFLAEGVRPRMQKPLVGGLLGTVGLAYHRLGQPQRAIEFYQQWLAIAREVGDRRGEGQVLGNLGDAYRTVGQSLRAIEFFQQALAIAREVGDRTGEVNALGNLGNAYYTLGQPQRAIECYEQDLPIAREVGDRRGEGAMLCNLGSAYAALGQPQRAIEFYQQRLAIAREVGDRTGEARACWKIGIQMVKLDRVAEAIPLMEVCVRFEQGIGHPDADKYAASVEQLRQRLAGASPPAPQ